MKNLSILFLSGLGNRSHTTSLFDDKLRSSFTIPSCLLSLPLLQTANLVSNALYGTIGEISSNLASLSLVGNLLTGTIPKSIQVSSSKLNNLQLSINRLSGIFVDDAFVNMEANSTIDLYSNRISGDIPSSISRFVEAEGSSAKPDILVGNVFSCDNNEAPSNLVDYQTYTCGTSSIDFYKYVYIGVSITIVLFIIYFMFLICWGKQNIRNSRCSSDSIASNDNNRDNVIMKEKNKVLFLFSIYFKHRPFPSSLFSGLISKQFMIACIIIALFMSLFNVGYTAYDSNKQRQSSFSTISVRYGWESAFVYVHGVLPFLLVVIGICTLLFIYLYYYYYRLDGTRVLVSSFSVIPGTTIATDNDKKKEEEATASSTTPQNSGFFSRLLSNTLSNLKKSSSRSVFVDSINFRRMIYLQLVNVIAVTFVNILYIVLVNSNTIPSTYKKIIPIILAIFKIIWANTYVVNMAKYGIRSKLSLQSVFVNYVFALVYLYILVPIVTVYFTDHECFYYPLGNMLYGYSLIDPIAETYPSVSPFSACFCGSICVCTVTVPPLSNANLISHFITPTWIYGYQCGVRILTNYIPAVLSSYTIKGVILPILKLLILSFPPGSRVRSIWIVRTALLPYTVNAMSQENLGRDQDREFRTFVYLSNLVTDLLMLLTYGILCPFLTFLVLWSIVVNEIIDHLQIGSYVYDMARLIDKEEEREERLKKSLSVERSASTDSTFPMDVSILKEITTSVESGRSVNENVIHKCDQSLSSAENVSSIIGLDKTDSSDNHSAIENNKQLSKADKVAIQFDLASRIYLGNCSELVMSVWKPIVLVILFFTTLILFDMIADVYGNVAGLVSVVIVWLVVYLLFGSGKKGLDRIVSCLQRTRTCEILDEIEEEEDLDSKGGGRVGRVVSTNIGVELKSVQGNPMIDNDKVVIVDDGGTGIGDVRV